MPLKKILSITLFLFISCHSFAQRGWNDGEIHLKNGETKTGLVKIGMISKDLLAIGLGDKVVRFKPAKKGKKRKYREPEVDYVILNGTRGNTNGRYEYVLVSDNKKELFRVISTGKVILYHRFVSMTSGSGGANGMMSSSTYEVDEYYALRESETIASPLITGRISKSFRKKAIAYFSDCPSLVAKLENKTYRKRDVEKAAKEYNRCDVSN